MSKPKDTRDEVTRAIKAQETIRAKTNIILETSETPEILRAINDISSLLQKNPLISPLRTEKNVYAALGTHLVETFNSDTQEKSEISKAEYFRHVTLREMMEYVAGEAEDNFFTKDRGNLLVEAFVESDIMVPDDGDPVIVPNRMLILDDEAAGRALREVYMADDEQTLRDNLKLLCRHLTENAAIIDLYEVLGELRFALIENLAESLFCCAQKKREPNEGEKLRLELLRYINSPVDLFSAFID